MKKGTINIILAYLNLACAAIDVVLYFVASQFQYLLLGAGCLAAAYLSFRVASELQKRK